MGWAAGFLGRVAATVIAVAGHQVHVGSLDNARRALTEARRRSAERHEINTLLAAVVTNRQQTVDRAVPRRGSATPDTLTAVPDDRPAPQFSPSRLSIGASSHAGTQRLIDTAHTSRTRRKARSGKATATIPADLAIDVVLESPGGSAADAAGGADDVAVDLAADVVARVDPLPGVPVPLTPASG